MPGDDLRAMTARSGESTMLAARRGAAPKLAEVSDELCANLTEATNHGDTADDAMSLALRAHMQVGQT